jgi:hypothetical protein
MCRIEAIRMNLFRSITVLAAFLLSVSVASASVIVDFSFEKQLGDTAGPISGSLFGLEADGSGQVPTEVVFSSVGGHTLPSGYVLGDGALSQGASLLFGSVDLTSGTLDRLFLQIGWPFSGDDAGWFLILGLDEAEDIEFGIFVVDDISIEECGDSLFSLSSEAEFDNLECTSSTISFEPQFDVDVALSTPATAGLFMLGLLGAGLARRHRKANA